MIDAPFALAFAGGMLATVNPCGFAMLPAYLSWFLGAEATTDDTPGGPLRALVVGGSVSLGFMAVFAAAGALLAWISHRVYNVAPWISLVIGAGLVIGGVLLLAGRELRVAMPRLDRGGRTQGLGSMFVFGVSYAIASIGCTLPVFFATLSTTFGNSVVSGLAYFVTYGLGMALVLMVLTLALALVGRSLVHHVRRILPVVNRIAGGLLVVAGAYVTWYGIVEIRGKGGDHGPVKVVTDWSASIQRWVDRVGAGTLGLILALVLAVAVLVALLRWPADVPEAADAAEPAEPAELRDR
ncbi:MAG TPA: cytochrome c biogenesis CcdA family protein [Acidimicrobiales bacterium]|nr:cytochrome c biogenesis CcdA family protein [Acidimicrobiales bacterium]